MYKEHLFGLVSEHLESLREDYNLMLDKIHEDDLLIARMEEDLSRLEKEVTELEKKIVDLETPDPDKYYLNGIEKPDWERIHAMESTIDRKPCDEK